MPPMPTPNAGPGSALPDPPKRADYNLRSPLSWEKQLLARMTDWSSREGWWYSDRTRQEDHQPSDWDHIVLFNCVALHHKSPHSGERQNKSRTWNRRFGPGMRADCAANVLKGLRDELSRRQSSPLFWPRSYMCHDRSAAVPRVWLRSPEERCTQSRERDVSTQTATAVPPGGTMGTTAEQKGGAVPRRARI